MKKILSIITTAAMVFGLAGCGGSSASASTSAAATSASASEAAASSSASAAADADRLVAQGATPKVGYLAPSLQTEFMIGIGKDLKAECDSRGWGYTEASFDNDSGKAVTSIENMVTSGVNVLLAMVSDSSCDDALKAANSCPFPVGSIYLSVTNTNPSVTFPGTAWQSIGSGRVLQGADSTHAAGSTIEAGLPNITGKIDHNYGETHGLLSGAFAATYGETKILRADWTSGNDDAISFDASRSSSVYGKSNTVQPPAFVVNMWQRTA